MRAAVVTSQRFSSRLFRRCAAGIAVGGSCSRIMQTRNNRSHDLHPGHTGDGRDHVMQLKIHVPQCFLHVLDVSSRILHQAFSMPQINPESGPVLSRMDTASKHAIGVQLLKRGCQDNCVTFFTPVPALRTGSRTD